MGGEDAQTLSGEALGSLLCRLCHVGPWTEAPGSPEQVLARTRISVKVAPQPTHSRPSRRSHNSSWLRLPLIDHTWESGWRVTPAGSSVVIHHRRQRQYHLTASSLRSMGRPSSQTSQQSFCKPPFRREINASASHSEIMQPCAPDLNGGSCGSFLDCCWCRCVP